MHLRKRDMLLRMDKTRLMILTITASKRIIIFITEMIYDFNAVTPCLF